MGGTAWALSPKDNAEPLFSVDLNTGVDGGCSVRSISDLDGDGVRDIVVGFGQIQGGHDSFGMIQVLSGKNGKLLRELKRFDMDP
jgi:hypothetical protein